MRITLGMTGFAFLASLGGHAHAADLRPVYKAAPAPVVAAYDWTGFYLGGHAGAGWADSNITVIDGTVVSPSGSSSSVDLKGLLGGFQGGFNWQAGNWVLGIEGEYSWADIDGSARIASPTFPAFTNQVDRKFDGIAMVTGRLGYAWNNSLLYAKGGWAWVDFNTLSTAFNPAGAAIGTSSANVSPDGWVIGGGWELGFVSNWTFKVEYNYIDLGTERYNATQSNGTTPARDLDGDLHLVKFGLNYRFGGYGKAPAPIVAKY